MNGNGLLSTQVPAFEYSQLSGPLPDLIAAPRPRTATFLIDSPLPPEDAQDVSIGTELKTGQLLTSTGAFAAITGTVTGKDPFAGEFGQSYTALTIDVADADQFDDAFAQMLAASDVKGIRNCLARAPGAPRLDVFADTDQPIDTIVIYGGDNDLLVMTGQYVLKQRIDAVSRGIHTLKELTGVEKVLIAVPGETVQGYGHIGAEVVKVAPVYPAAHPKMIMKDVLNRTVPAGSRCEALGTAFLTAEAVASIGAAYQDKALPTQKTISVIGKGGQLQMVSATLGTPIGDILAALNIGVHAGDRVIVGGPMTGFSIYTEAFPVRPDTDAVMVQDGASLARVSNYPCINCGECVRICPARIPVNMLVRFLEAGQHEEAANQYDLLSCLDCGLCSYVCVAQIPILQYIRLGKYELERIYAEEAANE